MAKTIKFTEKELEILRTLDVHDVCRASCFDSKMENKPYIHCEKCWVKLTIDSILEKIGEEPEEVVDGVEEQKGG